MWQRVVGRAGIGALLAVGAIGAAIMWLHPRISWRSQNHSRTDHNRSQSPTPWSAASEPIEQPSGHEASSADEATAWALLERLRLLVGQSISNPVELSDVRRKLIATGIGGIKAILRLFLDEPGCLIRERPFCSELIAIVDQLATPPGVAAYIAAFSKIDQQFSIQDPARRTEKDLIAVLSILSRTIGRRGTSDHVQPLIAIIPQLSLKLVRRYAITVLGLLFERFRDSRAKDFLMTLLHTEPESELRARIASILGACKDEAVVADLMTRLMKVAEGEKSRSFSEATSLARAILESVNPEDAMLLLEVALKNSRNQMTPKMCGFAISDAYSEGRLDSSLLGVVCDHLRFVADTPSQVMYLSALQAIQSKDPRILETLREMGGRPLDPLAHGPLIYAMGAHASPEEFIESARIGVQTSNAGVVVSASFAMNLYVYKHPEDRTVWDAMIQYARSGEKTIRLTFISRMIRVSRELPDLFAATLEDLASRDPDAEIRHAAKEMLESNGKR